MKPTVLLLFLLTIIGLPLGIASADMGQVHVEDAQISETSQKAIIFHNGQEEVLILGTDIQATRKIGVLRFIPFPAEPQVSLAPAKAFEVAAALLQEHHLVFLQASKGEPPQKQPVELRLEKKLGAHDMAVIKVNDPVHFRSWVNDFFKKKNLPVKAEYATAEAIVDDYVARGISYFVLDFVEVTEETRFVEPVLYRFACEELYYPLKTSNTFGGIGGIDLLLVLPGTLCKPSLGAYDTCLGFTHYVDHVQASTSAAVSTDELLPIFPETGQFFGDKQVFIQMVTYWGDYVFDRDIFADVSQAAPHAFGYVEEGQGSPWTFPIVEILKDIDKKPPEEKSNAGDGQ